MPCPAFWMGLFYASVPQNRWGPGGAAAFCQAGGRWPPAWQNGPGGAGRSPAPPGLARCARPPPPRAPAVFSQAVAAARATMAQEAAPPKGARPPQAVEKVACATFSRLFIAPLRLRRGQELCRNPCYARLFADLPYTPPNPIIASGGYGPRTPGRFFDRRRRPRPPKGRGLL